MGTIMSTSQRGRGVEIKPRPTCQEPCQGSTFQTHSGSDRSPVSPGTTPASASTIFPCITEKPPRWFPCRHLTKLLSRRSQKDLSKLGVTLQWPQRRGGVLAGPCLPRPPPRPSHCGLGLLERGLSTGCAFSIHPLGSSPHLLQVSAKCHLSPRPTLTTL